MAVGDKADLLNTVSTILPDNNTGEISPSDLRTTESAIITYNVNMEEVNPQKVSGRIDAPSILFAPTATAPPWAEGEVFYDPAKKALSYYNDISDTTVNIGQEVVLRAYNNNGTTITSGQVVRDGGGAVGGLPVVMRSIATSVIEAGAIGIATHDIEVGTTGYITYIGEVGGLDTSAFNAGDRLYVSDTVLGGLTNVAPGIVSVVGLCLVSDAVDGRILVAPSEPREVFAVGQNLSTTSFSQSLTTTPTPVEGYDAVAGLSVGVVIDTTGGTVGNRCKISPLAPPYSGYYDVSFNISGTSSDNRVFLAELYVNGVATGLIEFLDLSNNNIDNGSVSFPRVFTQTPITNLDVMEVYMYTQTGSATFTSTNVGFNAKRVGVV